MNIGSISLTGLSSQVARAASDAQEETAKAQVAAQGQQLQSPADPAAQAPMLEAQRLIAAATGMGGKVNTYA